MKPAAFDALYSQALGFGGTLLISSDGSNSGPSGGDVLGESGDLSVVRLRSAVSLSSNLTGSVGDVLTLIQASPLTAQFATPSNSGGAAFGSNTTRVSETAAVGASSNTSRADHIHDGIGTVTASSSNTLQRGTLHLRSGSGVVFALSDSDGSGALDTLTLSATATGGGPGSDYVSGPSGSGQIVIPDMVETSPTTVPGLVTWLAADHLSGYNDGDTVLIWPNRAPGIIGFDATAFGSPTYETAEVNSLPVVRLGGSAYWRLASPAVPSPGLSIFVVHKLSSLVPTYSGLIGAGFTDLGGLFIKSNGKSALYATAGSGVYDGTGSITYGTTNWNYTTLVFGPQTYATRRNGSSDSTAAYTGTHGWNTVQIYLGNQAVASRVYSGDIAELLIFSRALTSSEVTTVESYLATKYGL